MYLARTTFAYEEASAHLERVGSDPLIENYLVQYLLVSFYAEIEEKIRDIMCERISSITDRKVSHFVTTMNEGMFRRVKKTEINDVLYTFNCGDGDLISEYLNQMNLQPYFDAITNRHKVSHDQGSSMTLSYFGQALPCGEAILGAVKAMLNQP